MLTPRQRCLRSTLAFPLPGGGACGRTKPVRGPCWIRADGFFRSQVARSAEEH